ncbi:MAG: hypothetical protein IK014_00715 [Lachnospiraceae bacterium]|nr:hypothetical protein [Lachnospiraceae bacterium]MBR4779859.1 hypothetical protein [Lachnospiraceae bacterium]MBR4815981.1 hypothetical protein [Lachnospiraceae bacterium]
MKKEYAPILPFDGSQTDKFEMYDNADYRFGIDMYKDEKPVKLHHNSMIKYYSCKMEDKPVRLGGD